MKSPQDHTVTAKIPVLSLVSGTVRCKLWCLIALFIGHPLYAQIPGSKGGDFLELLVWFVLATVSTILVMLIRKYRLALEQIREIQEHLETKIKECSNLQKELDELNTTDQLTGLGNRRYLYSVMERDVSRIEREYGDWLEGRSFAPVNTDMVFMLLDLHSTGSEDLAGAGASDRVLLHIKDLMRQVVRDSDVLIRWESDCFLAVFRQANRDSGPFLAERLRRAIENHPIRLDGGKVARVTCSIGFSCYPFLRKVPMRVSWEEVISIAKVALVYSRAQGKNHWYGIYSTKKSIEKEDLVAEILANTDQLVGDKALRIFSSGHEISLRTID